VAGDLGDGAVGEGHIHPPVAGTHGVADVVQGEIQGLARPLEGAEGAVGAIGPGTGGAEGEQLAIGEQHGLRADRPDVDAHGYGRGRLPIQAGILPDLFAPSPEFLLLFHCSQCPSSALAAPCG
jgi:hypothetical protein